MKCHPNSLRVVWDDKTQNRSALAGVILKYAHVEVWPLRTPEADIESLQSGKIRIGDFSLPLGYFPVIIRNEVTRWPAFSKWTKDYFSKNFGKFKVDCFTAGPHGKFLQQYNRKKTLPFSRFLSLIYSENDVKLLHYLSIESNTPLFEALQGDFIIPPVLDDYNAGATGIWMGQKGNLTPFHHNWWHSLLVQVTGQKQFILVSPLETMHLQRRWKPEELFDLSSPPYISPEDIEGIGANFFSGNLNAGEILYIPPFWYHQVSTLTNGNISIPLRYDTNQSTLNPLFNFSQTTAIRDITNTEATPEIPSITEVLRNNRRIFSFREKSFIRALIRERKLPVSVDDLLQRIS